MKSIRLVMWLLAVSSLLAACGGGGDARSPDRPGLSIDPSTMQLEFIDGETSLPGTGNNRISVRMTALQSDGINKNVGPAQNITARVAWTLSNTPLAALSTDDNGELKFRTVNGNIGTVIDIESTQQMSIDQAAVAATITGSFKGSSRVGNFTIIPPAPNGQPRLQGDTTILLDPTLPDDSETSGYRLLQYFTNTPVPENRTHKFLICSDSEFATVEAPQPQTDGVADVTFTNPFTPDGDNTPVDVKLFAIDAEANSSCDGATPNGERELIVKLRPATFASVDICAVINPANDACSENGSFNEEYIDQCRGVDADSIFVPAAQQLQFVAKKTFNSATDPSQTLTEYVCSEEGREAWSNSDDIIFAKTLDENDNEVRLFNSVEGTATTVDRLTYEQLVALDDDPSSVVTGNFGEGVRELQDSLELKLVDARVDAISIVRTDGLNPDNDADNRDSLYVNSFIDGIEYRALCRFSDLSETQQLETCPNGLIRWASTEPTVAEPSAEATPTVTLQPKTNVQLASDPFDFSLTVTYIGSDQDITAERFIEARDPGELQALRLYMRPDSRQPEDIEIDPFACVGRDDLVESVSQDEGFVSGGQQFEVYAVFANVPGSDMPNLENPNAPDSGLVYVTPEDEIQFSAVQGFWSGTWADPAVCQGIQDIGEIPDLGEETDGIIVNDAPASFDPNAKGRLKADGLLRLGTVCVTGFADKASIPQLSTDLQNADGDRVATVDGSTVLVLPAANDELLAGTSPLCETLEPVLTLGGSIEPFGGPGIILPVVYGVSIVADPLLASLSSNDDGGVLPVEAILSGLLYGDFSGIADGAPDIGFGLGTLTGMLIEGQDEVPGLGVLLDFTSSCLLSAPLDVVGGLLDTLLSFFTDTSGFDDINFDDCTAFFGDMGL